MASSAPARTRLYDVPAPAKLNLFLHVTGRRSDGYHTLQTVFRLLDLCDTLDFEVRRDGQIVCDNPLPGVTPANDLIVRAAQALQQASGTALGAQIHCTKRIPAGGGLGGGSSDAATTLIALNRLWGTRLTRAQLLALALPLGADVPVFVFGQSAFAQGLGADLQALNLPERAYVIVQPPVVVPTAAVFAAPDLTRDTPSVTIADFLDWQERKQPGTQPSPGLRSLPFFGRNDLQAVAQSLYPQVAWVGAQLSHMGWCARMTGSGACWLIEFATLAQARVCQQEIDAKMASPAFGARVSSWLAQGVSQHPLHEWVL